MNSSDHRLFMVFSNIAYFVPLVVSIVYQEYFFAVLVIVLIILSTAFHCVHVIDADSRSARLLRMGDRCATLLVALYMMSQVSEFDSLIKQTVFMLASTSVFIFYLVGLLGGKYKAYHPWWHVCAAIIMTASVLF